MLNTVVINQIHYNLEEVLQNCWHRLINGSISSKHPYHCPAIATINHGYPEIRTVVLRKVLPTEKMLIFHTDNRSPKVSQIKANNAISWLFYDPKSRIQIRVKTEALIHVHDDISLQRWNESKVESRKDYLVHPAPSTLSISPTDGMPVHLTNTSLTNENLALGYDNFAVVKTIVKEMDWLYLNHNGHRRARFIYGVQEVEKYWMVP